MVTRRFFAHIAALAALSAMACTPQHEKPCPANQPAFRIQLTATDGPLPPDTHIAVKYSGNEHESYSLSAGGPGNEDVCCRAGVPVSGALPDVSCGLLPPSQVSTVTPAARDAAAAGDASPPRGAPADAAASLDAMSARVGPDAAAPLEGGLDASSAIDASVSKVPDASVKDASSNDSGASAQGASQTVAVFCDLWTNGVAEVLVDGTGYAELDAVLDDPYVPDLRCGVETVDHRLLLSHGDGGLK